ncbi:hypothetical protein F5X68DRAFT_60086 [Plectosphaerella plurivora]|uniref:Uncharacterized protein n=1 Tax=Plectosphaerella plurivora TaxID=936078 RepID=A0A9P8VJG3_9PEZI|nr:hypothetical protein F5X68DRAFT_60086 [Plectosphaerella plurivora]
MASMSSRSAGLGHLPEARLCQGCHEADSVDFLTALWYRDGLLLRPWERPASLRASRGRTTPKVGRPGAGPAAHVGRLGKTAPWSRSSGHPFHFPSPPLPLCPNCNSTYQHDMPSQMQGFCITCSPGLAHLPVHGSTSGAPSVGGPRTFLLSRCLPIHTRSSPPHPHLFGPPLTPERSKEPRWPQLCGQVPQESGGQGSSADIFITPWTS